METATPAAIAWNDAPNVDYYRVYRDGTPVADTAVAFFPDSPMAALSTYEVEAWRDGRPVGRSAPLPVQITAQPIHTAPVIESHVNHAGVLLRMPGAAEAHVVAYGIARRAMPDGKAESIARIPARLASGQTHRDVPPAGRWEYTVVALNAAGEAGPAAVYAVDFPPPVKAVPEVDLPLTSLPGGAKVAGEVAFGDSGATFRGGAVVLPSRPEMDLGPGMTLDFEFTADALTEIPVLISHGHWLTDGWFVQVFGGRIMLRAIGGDAVGPAVEVGKTYAVRVVYDGQRLHLRVNGEWIEQDKAIIDPLPSARDLVIGCYEAGSRQYPFRGRIKGIKIWSDALLD